MERSGGWHGMARGLPGVEDQALAGDDGGFGIVNGIGQDGQDGLLLPFGERDEADEQVVGLEVRTTRGGRGFACRHLDSSFGK
jgi:hypothetical protein